MSIILKLVGILVGILILFLVIRSLKSKTISEAQSVLWILAAIILIILSVFPSLLYRAADVFGISWPPAVLLFCAVIILSIMAFTHSEGISTMKSQIVELSMQIALLKEENAELKKNIISSEKKTDKGEYALEASGAKLSEER